MKDNLNTDNIKKIIKSEIESYFRDSLDNDIKKIIKKPNSETREEIIDIIKNSLEAVYKVLWQKRDFWKTDIK